MTSDHEDQQEVLRAQLRSKATKNPADMELYELSQLAGITMDPHVFEILLDLLRKNVPPEAIVHMLRSMCSTAYHQLQQQNTSQPSALSSSKSSSLAPTPQGAPARGSGLLASGSIHSRSLQVGQNASPPTAALNKASSLSDLHVGRSAQGQHLDRRGVKGYSTERVRSSKDLSGKALSQTEAFVTSRPRAQSSRSHQMGLGQNAGTKRRPTNYN
ncbi:mitotic-spindle organizing protein 2b [Plakobranchus ocellatus]|uniref:Mitotic-spindle organizing protein 2b n=1 Tax=Plakobranchus ocellatus TaxID=259542 RepID=A0AAV4A6R6_9GAST|nr:mitotic-spindle organizing protein 2b [Plakobranchus ocellatus]